MKLEHQVSSLALSQKLKELGVKQKSIAGWRLRYITDGNGEELSSEWVILCDGFVQDWKSKFGESISAFTVAELGEMLPNWIGHPTDLPFKSLGKKTIMPWAWIVKGFYGSEKTEADARASMLIYLIENSLIKL